MLKISAACCLMMAFGMVGCQQEEGDDPNENPKQEEQHVSFTANLKTRATETAFEKGDEIGVFAVVSGHELDYQSVNYGENCRYRYLEDLFEGATQNDALIPDAEGLSYYVYYPYVSGVKPAFTFSAKADQSTHQALTASDLCTAYASNTKSKRVNLTFSHRQCHVIVELVGSNLASKQISVKLKNVLTQTEVDLGANKFEGTGDKGDVTLGSQATNTYECVVAPQTIEAGQQFILVTANGKEVSFSQGTDIVLRSGSEATYIIDIDKEVVIGGDINPWKQDGPVTQLGDVTFSDDALKFYVTACERVGRSLVIDFLLENRSGRNLTDLRIYEAPLGGWQDDSHFNNRMQDDVGNEYWNGIYINFGTALRNLNYEGKCPMLAAGERIEGQIIQRGGFDDSDHAKHVTFHRVVSCSSMKFADGFDIGNGYGILRMDNVPITDQRVLTGGVQSPDRKLEVKVTGCAIDELGDCVLSFTIKNNTGELLKDFCLSLGGLDVNLRLRDSEDTDYNYGYIERNGTISRSAMQLNGSEWGGGAHTITLPAGASVEGAVVARGFSQTAKAITCIMGCESDTRYFEDSYLRFYDVPVKR